MPIDRGVIDQQLQALGETRWWDQRELRDLPAVLHADERILAISHGKIARARWLRRPWLIVVTDRRLLCVRSGRRSGWRQLEVSAAQLTRVSLRIGPFRGRVVLLAGGVTYRLLVPRPDAYRLEAALAGLVPPRDGPSPGFAPARMVHRMIDHVLAMPAAALGPDDPPRKVLPKPSTDASRLEERLEALQSEVQALREQVDFLEDLLRKRHVRSSGAADASAI